MTTNDNFVLSWYCATHVTWWPGVNHGVNDLVSLYVNYLASFIITAIVR